MTDISSYQNLNKESDSRFATNQNTTGNIMKLLKPSEVASILNISRSFAYHLLQTGAIPVVRVGTACRVRPQDLESYILQNLGRQTEGN